MLLLDGRIQHPRRQTAGVVFPFLFPQTRLPFFSVSGAGISCPCTSRNLDVFLDSSPPQLSPNQVLLAAPPAYLLTPSTFSSPHTICRSHHFSSGSLPEPPHWSLLLWTVLRAAAGRILLEPRSELVTPCFTLSNGHPVYLE